MFRNFVGKCSSKGTYGILAKRKSKSHRKDLKKNNYDEIDLVIVVFTIWKNIKTNKNHEKIIENIDIGPTMVRAAAIIKM